MNNALYLPFDTETVGLTDDVSLLSAHFAACDPEFNIIEELDLLIKPNNGVYVVTSEALEVNKINLIAHDKAAMTYSQAGAELRDFLWRNSDNGKVKLVPVGKNVNFDVVKVNANILGAKTWNQFVSYRQYDLTALIIYLKRKGKLAPDAPESLEKLANYFNYSFAAHTAKGDNYAGIYVLKKLESL